LWYSPDVAAPRRHRAGLQGDGKGAIGGNGAPIIVVTTVTMQTDSAVTGTGTIASGDSTLHVTVMGTSMRPNLELGIGGESYTGTYVTADSVVGVLQADPSVGGFTLSLKRQ
jgi:hypothetical protein